MSIIDATAGFFQNGGPFMYPILIVLALGLSIALERWVYLTRTSLKNRSLWRELVPYIKEGRFTEAADLAKEGESAIGRILGYGLARIRSAGRRDDVERAMEESMMEVTPHLEKRTHYLATFANLATLLGLLGTIIGLIEAFTAVAGADPAQKADLLSASISVAMNTTAFGLMVAIPLLFVHAVLQTKTTEIIDSLEMVSVKFLNAVDDKRRAQGQQPAARQGAAA
jgi:Biopolymer transport proteins